MPDFPTTTGYRSMLYNTTEPLCWRNTTRVAGGPLAGCRVQSAECSVQRSAVQRRAEQKDCRRNQRDKKEKEGQEARYRVLTRYLREYDGGGGTERGEVCAAMPLEERSWNLEG